MKHEKFPKPSEPFTEIAKILQRAARNGTRAHFSPAHVQAIVSSEAFLVLCQEMQKEISEKWASAEEMADFKSAHSGFGTGRTGTTGTSVGLSDAQRAACPSVSQVARQIIRQQKPTRP